MHQFRDKWRTQWDENGRRRSKVGEKEEIRRFEMELELGIADTTVKKRLITFGEFAEKWLEDYCAIEKAAAQLKQDGSVIRTHILPALAHLPIGGIKKAELQELRLRIRAATHFKTGKPLRTKTVNNALAILKKMFVTAIDWEYIPTSPAAGLKMFPVEEQEVVFWSTEERDRFYRFAKQVDPEFAELVLFACHTGLRRGELAALQRHQLDFNGEQVMVNATFCSATKQRQTRSKNRKIGFVPLNDVAMGLMASRRLLLPEAPVFGVELLSNASVRLRRLCKKVGARPLRFHDLRHTYGSSLVMAGVPLYTVQKLLRHKTPSTTQRYAHLAQDHLHAASALLCQDAHRLHTKGSESQRIE